MRRVYGSDSIEALIGLTLTEVVNGDEVIVFKAEGCEFHMQHHQDCCESVYVEDICGDLSDLVGSPILTASEECSAGEEGPYSESSTWTFYKLSTAKGYVTIRWFGQSNGYYSESVSVDRYEP